MKFSVLMSVYRKDKPEFVALAIDSITKHQTLKPDEIVVVVDGPIPDDLSKLIADLENSKEFNFKVTRLPENRGLGNALQMGMMLVSNELVARMDADDVALPERFERQVKFMSEHPEIAASGGYISEFIDNPDNIVSYRKVPIGVLECKKYYQDRDPLNHMTVILRKSAVINVGNYQPWHLDEDTYLWGRLLKNGYDISNIPSVLVNVRVGKEMYARRGGWEYFKSDSKILKWKLENGLMTKSRYIYNYLARFGVQVMMPNSLRAWVFKNLLRTK